MRKVDVMYLDSTLRGVAHIINTYYAIIIKFQAINLLEFSESLSSVKFSLDIFRPFSGFYYRLA